MAAAAPTGDAPFFTLTVTGQVETCQFHGMDNLYCKYSFVHGPDWVVVQGVEEGITQLATRNDDGGKSLLVWNFPIDISFKSTNAFGWPQIVLSVYGIDAMGRDVIRGYGTSFLPTGAGKFNKYVRLFVPLSSSPLQQFRSWILGTPPEYQDPKFLTKSTGREVTRTTSNGIVKLNLQAYTKNMSNFGYSDVAAGAKESIVL